MKIGVVTIPPRDNYGGAMQAYALVRVLRNMGHEAYLIMPEMAFFKLKPLSAPFVYLRRAFRRYILGDKSVIVLLEQQLIKQYYSVHQVHIKFLNDNIEQYHCKDYSEIPSDMFDALVVGSDQVWSAKYYPDEISKRYLNFAKEWDIKRYTYAASFGVDNKEYTSEQIVECAELCKLFDAVSVREDSGVALCREYFGVEAEHLLDPTMLLDKENYMELAKDEATQEGKLFEYILDRDDDKELITNRCCEELNLEKNSIVPRRKYIVNSICSNIEDYIIQSPSRWIAAFRDAEFVVTDSFHGVVFSIIFNKQFVVIINKARGAARFDSILRMFGLEDRIVDNVTRLTEILSTPINYRDVEAIKEAKQNQSIDFLEINL